MKIISGAQTGIDRAALDAAIASGLDAARAFTLAFRAFASAPDAILERLWAVWMTMGQVGDPLAALPGLLASLLASAPAACDRALEINARTLTSVRSILLNRLDGRRPVQPPEAPPITHANIRGPQFFH